MSAGPRPVSSCTSRRAASVTRSSASTPPVTHCQRPGSSRPGARRIRRIDAGRPSSAALKIQTATMSGRNGLTTGLRRERSGQQLAEGEDDVRGPLGEAAHVPRVPRLAVRDQRPNAVARGGETTLLARPDPVEHLDLERIAGDARDCRVTGDLLHERGVVGTETEPQAAIATRAQRRDGERDEARVDLALRADGDLGRLVVRALDEANRGTQWHEPLEVRGGSAEVRLEADAGAGVRRAQPL